MCRARGRHNREIIYNKPYETAVRTHSDAADQVTEFTISVRSPVRSLAVVPQLRGQFMRSGERLDPGKMSIEAFRTENREINNTSL